MLPNGVGAGTAAAAAAALVSAAASGAAAAAADTAAAADAAGDGTINGVLPLVVGVVCSAAALGACLFGGKPKQPASNASAIAVPPENTRPQRAPGPVQLRSAAMAQPTTTPTPAAGPPPNVQELYSKPQKRGSRPASPTLPPPAVMTDLLYEDLDESAPPLFRQSTARGGVMARITPQEAESSLRAGEKVFRPQAGPDSQSGEVLYEAVVDIQALYARPDKTKRRSVVNGPPPSTPAPDPTSAPDVADLYTAVVKPKRPQSVASGPPPTGAAPLPPGDGLPAVSALSSLGSPPTRNSVSPRGPDSQVDAQQNYENIDSVVSRMARGADAPAAAGAGASSAGASGDVYGDLDEFIQPAAVEEPAPVGARAAEKAANDSHYVPLDQLTRGQQDAPLYQPIDEVVPANVSAPTFVRHAHPNLYQPVDETANAGPSENERFIAGWQKLSVSREDAERYLHNAKATPGAYLIRRSTKVEGENVLSMMQPSGIPAHFRIINHKGKFFVYDVLNERKEFDSINELLECYQNFDPSLPGGLPALLTRCIPPAASGSR